METAMIGVLGGVGPYAGLDLVQKIFDQTEAKCDQEHLAVALLSLPNQVGDRTDFLLGKTETNPADVVFEILVKLEQLGADVVGIPCNTLHSAAIFNALLEKLRKAQSKIKLLNMIDEVVKFILGNHPNIKNVGVLCTTGAYKTMVYQQYLAEAGLNVILPSESMQDEMVNKAIYDLEDGIKAKSNPVSESAKSKLLEVVDCLQKQGAEAIILGCTELPLAINDKKIGETLIVDSTLVLARALIKQVSPWKLKPYADS